MSGNFGYMGWSNPYGDLDQMSFVGRYGGRNHVCNISWLSVKGCGCGERGKFVFSHWLDASPLQHWSHSHTTVWPCDKTLGKNRKKTLGKIKPEKNISVALTVHRTLFIIYLLFI